MVKKINEEKDAYGAAMQWHARNAYRATSSPVQFVTVTQA